MTTIKIDVYTNRDAIQASFPARWIVCPACEGEGTTTSHVECDGGGLTSAELAEACRDDEDFAEKYFGGAYDRPCPTCNGRSTIQVIDADRVTGWRQRILLKAYLEQERDGRAIDAEMAAERRMGA